ncbi:MAG TPA: hypothetical protein PKZ12_04585 [Smithellaceae bacterium]|nr:hypothetical protein [Smithellaceae bacterium]
MIIRFLIYAALIYVIYRIIKLFFRTDRRREEDIKQERPPVQPAEEELVEDLNCHTYIPQSQAVRKEIAGQIYYFCSEKCSEEYRKLNNSK